MAIGGTRSQTTQETQRNSRKTSMTKTTVSVSGVCCRTTPAPLQEGGPVVGKLIRWLVGWGAGSDRRTRQVSTLSVA